MVVKIGHLIQIYSKFGVSDIAIDPNNTNIMYIITGDRDSDDTYAYGLMKSIDGGESWNTTGLSFNINSAYRGNRVLINPNNTNILIVSTRKSGYGETFRSTDGGENWELVFKVLILYPWNLIQQIQIIYMQ